MDPRISLHVRTAYGWLLAWAILWTFAVLDGTPLASHALPRIHFAMGGIGFAGILVVGVAHRLGANFTGRDLPPRWLLRTEVATASVAALLATLGLQPFVSVPSRPLLQGAGWALAAFSVVAVGAAASQWRTSVPSLARCNGGPGDPASVRLLAVAFAYMVAAGLLAPWLGVTDPIIIHLWLVGGVTTTIYAVAHRVLPRFSRMRARPRLHDAQAACAALGPLFVVGALHFSSTPWSALGGLVEFAAVVLHVWMATAAVLTRRGDQPATFLLALGAWFLLAGVSLGIHFLNHPEMRVHVPVHAVNNLLGFLGLTVVGMGATMLGVGIRSVPGEVHRDVWRIAVPWTALLILWEVLAYLDLPFQGLVSALLGVTVAAHAVLGIQAGIRLRTPRPLPRP